MEKQRFSDAQVGDEVYSMAHGDGEITNIRDGGRHIVCMFKTGTYGYYATGMYYSHYGEPILFYRKGEERYLTERPNAEFYAVETPVTSDGNILFNGRQVLTYNDGGYDVWTLSKNKHYDCRDKFIWVPCKREDLRPGDTAYRRTIDDGFGSIRLVCKIMGDREHVYVDNKDIYVAKEKWNQWFKLTKKEGL